MNHTTTTTCHTQMTQGTAGKDVLVPLSQSLYARGQMEASEKAIIDIGTGYFVEKVWRGGEECLFAQSQCLCPHRRPARALPRSPQSIPDAINYFDRRVKYITAQIEPLQKGTMERVRELQGMSGCGAVLCGCRRKLTHDVPPFLPISTNRNLRGV